jgi:hypothetical protein
MTGDRAANSDRCLALMAFRMKGFFLRATPAATYGSIWRTDTHVSRQNPSTYNSKDRAKVKVSNK